MSDLHQGKHRASKGTVPSDSFLLRQSLAGDEYAFEALVSRYRPAIHLSELYREDEDAGISLIESILDPRPLPEEIVERLDMDAALEQAMDRLPPRFRSIVHLRYCGQLTFAEIGFTLKMPTPTVKTYYYRALPRLRSALANSV